TAATASGDMANAAANAGNGYYSPIYGAAAIAQSAVAHASGTASELVAGSATLALTNASTGKINVSSNATANGETSATATASGLGIRQNVGNFYEGPEEPFYGIDASLTLQNAGQIQLATAATATGDTANASIYAGEGGIGQGIVQFANVAATVVDSER